MAFVPVAESMYQNHHDQDTAHFPLSCTPYDFQGVSPFLMRRSMSFSGMNQVEEVQPDDDMSDDCSQMLGEKKRRLNLEQVKALEKSFEIGNKLEPERKMQLARALGLQPRQVSIWFQNRRARWKTKQLERDYDVLKKQFDALKSDNDQLKSQNKKLQTQLLAMKNRESTMPINLNMENEGSWINGSDENSTFDVKFCTTTYPSNKHAAVFPLTIGPGTQLHNLSRPDNSLQLGHKIENAPMSNEGFCNVMFGEENPEFWPWSEHQNFH